MLINYCDTAAGVLQLASDEKYKRHGLKNNLRVHKKLNGKPVFPSLSLSHLTALYSLNGHLYPLVVPESKLLIGQFAEYWPLIGQHRNQKRVIKVVIPANYCFIVLSERPTPQLSLCPRELFLSEFKIVKIAPIIRVLWPPL